jgi:hypothetical protein
MGKLMIIISIMVDEEVQEHRPLSVLKVFSLIGLHNLFAFLISTAL